MFLACSSVSVSKKWCYTPEYAQSPYACAGHPRGMKWRVPLLVDLEIRLVAYRAYLRDRGLSSWPRGPLGARWHLDAVFHPRRLAMGAPRRPGETRAGVAGGQAGELQAGEDRRRRRGRHARQPGDAVQQHGLGLQDLEDTAFVGREGRRGGGEGVLRARRGRAREGEGEGP